MSSTEIRETAEWLVEARLSGRPASECPAAGALAGEAAGYRVQRAGHSVLAARGLGGLAGYKVGCTNRAVQELLKIPGPGYGGVVAGNLHERTVELAREALQAPGIECEVAFRIARDLDAAGAPYDRESVRPHVASCAAAMEIVENRYGDPREAPFGLMIADDFFQRACVVGPPVEDWQGLDLAALAGRTLIDGEVAASGSGVNVMGHPLEPLAWLANRLVEDGRRLEAGQWVLTGTMADPVWLGPGPCEATVIVEGLGQVTARFA